MKFKTSIGFVIIFFFSILPGFAGGEGILKISGCVKTPFSLTIKDVEKFQQSEIQVNDVTKNGAYKGVFTCRGLSLKTLLEIAGIQKKDTDFNKPVDLAVVVKNTDNAQVVLSWGEIFFKNPDNVVIALSAVPVFPHKGIDHFEDKAAYHTMMKTLNRKIAFPRLVIAGDLYSDRCIESISEISVVDLKPQVEGKKSPSVFSENFSIKGPGMSPVLINELPQSEQTSIRAHVVGEGRGYHGTHDFCGIPFFSLLEKAKASLDVNTVFIVSAPDAYRSLISYGELFFGAHGNRILITDRSDGRAWENGGRFILVLPDDLMADREVKAISEIEIINIAQ